MTEKNSLIWNPFRQGYLENPHEQLRLLREQNPIHKGINERWILLKYTDVKFFLTNPTFKTVKISQAIASKNRYLNGRENLNQLSDVSAKWMLFFDPPEHTDLRAMVSKIWNTYDLTEDIKTIVEENIELLKKKKCVDIINDFANYIPSKVICKVLGLPPEDYTKFRDWSYCFNSMLEPFTSLHDFVYYNHKAKEFYEYLDKIIRAKTQNPDTAFISKFIVANQALSKPLNHSEIISVIAFLFFAGIETSVNLFGQSVLLLIKNPEQARLLCEDSSITPTAVEELLRYISPSQYTTRIVSEDVEIRGQRIKAGEFLMGATVSANYDADIFENPEKLDLTRKFNPHLSFGYGLHYCLGARLAREEISISFPALLRNFPKIALHPQQNYQWDRIIINRGLKSLPVVLS